MRTFRIPILVLIVAASGMAGLLATGGDRQAAAGQSDVAITSVYFSPDAPQPNELLTITVYVENFGESGTGDFLIEFYADRSVPPETYETGDASCPIASLGPQGSSSCDVTWTYTDPGLVQAYLFANREYVMWESDQTNNITGPHVFDVTDDSDGDGVADASDNCPLWPNPHAVPPDVVGPGGRLRLRRLP